MKCFLCCNEMFQASKSKWIYILHSSQYILLNFYKRESFCNSRYGIRITRLQFTNDLSIFEQLNMENMTSLKFCLERLNLRAMYLWKLKQLNVLTSTKPYHTWRVLEEDQV